MAKKQRWQQKSRHLQPSGDDFFFRDLGRQWHFCNLQLFLDRNCLVGISGIVEHQSSAASVRVLDYTGGPGVRELSEGWQRCRWGTRFFKKIGEIQNLFKNRKKPWKSRKNSAGWLKNLDISGIGLDWGLCRICIELCRRKRWNTEASVPVINTGVLMANLFERRMEVYNPDLWVKLRSHNPLGVIQSSGTPQIRYKLDNTERILYAHNQGFTQTVPSFWINPFHLFTGFTSSPSLSDNPCSPMESWVAVRLEEPSVVSQAEVMFASEKHPKTTLRWWWFGICISFRCISLQIWLFLVSM